MPATVSAKPKTRAKAKPKAPAKAKAELEKVPKVDQVAEIPELEVDGAEAVAGLWYDFARSGQKKTLRVARKAVNVAVPFQGDHQSRRRQMIDGAFSLADQAGAMPLAFARAAMRGALGTYFDIVVNIDAFNGIAVDVTVPTNVKTLSR